MGIGSVINGKVRILWMRSVIWRVENKSFDFGQKVYCIYFLDCWWFQKKMESCKNWL